MAVGLIQKYFNQSVCVVLVLVAGLSHSPKAIADPPSELPPSKIGPLTPKRSNSASKPPQRRFPNILASVIRLV
ncbi:hypothetical protein [Picosynechococcus sp. PCC 11901]|uniref:hypothetical protein n=1 Tax=Picosynechococcus sp. PCC 11901 TaxID=2579791 RepID=UPI002105C0B1|nr:hypothetical protein [Picosynechococcus sp. PCC 11901]